MSATAQPIAVSSTDGVELALWDLGGQGKALLFAHATMFAGHIWAPLVPYLPGYRCWAPDLRGHGHSVTPEAADLSWPAAADDVLAVIDRLGLHGVRAAGHSMGGTVLLLAEMARPGTFEGLWCYDPVLRPAGAATESTPPALELAAGARRRRAVFPSREAARANFASKPPLASAQPEAISAYVEWCFEDLPDGTVTLRCRPDREATIYELGETAGAFERLAEVRCPVTVVHGYPEPDHPSMWAAEVAAHLPQGREVVFPELSHFGPLEDPAGMARSIEESFGS